MTFVVWITQRVCDCFPACCYCWCQTVPWTNDANILSQKAQAIHKQHLWKNAILVITGFSTPPAPKKMRPVLVWWHKEVTGIHVTYTRLTQQGKKLRLLQPCNQRNSAVLRLQVRRARSWASGQMESHWFCQLPAVTCLAAQLPASKDLLMQKMSLESRSQFCLR